MLHATDHIVYHVTDIERTVAWYQDIFGLNPEGLDAWRSGDKPFASVRATPTLILDFMNETPTGTNINHIAFTTTPDDFDNFVADHPDLIEMGPAQLSGAQGLGDGIYLRDPDNHRIELRTYR